MTELHARLVVPDSDRAIEFYQKALGAELVERYRDDVIGKVVHAAIRVDGVIIALVDAHEEFGNTPPESLGGSPVMLQLRVDDARAVGKSLVDAGAEVIFPIRDQFYGKREGRLRDPFGHIWIISQQLEELSPEEVQRRVDAFHDS